MEAYRILSTRTVTSAAPQQICAQDTMRPLRREGDERRRSTSLPSRPRGWYAQYVPGYDAPDSIHFSQSEDFQKCGWKVWRSI